jgi:selenide,water dikinase
LGPGDLERILANLPAEDAPELLSSLHSGEDAGVYLLREDLAVVMTVDFFPPIVDDPYLFGQIAAANALSDIYAMNARPLTAMNLLAFPCDMPAGVMEAVLTGGYDKVHEAGALIVGGHTIEDDEPKYGLSVMGTVRPDEITTLQGALPGDILILTKAIGTGILTTALKAGLNIPSMDEAISSMCALNGNAARVLASRGVHAMTDVTGFGLVGHLFEMARASGLGADLWSDEVPLFPDTLALVAQGMAARSSAEEFFLLHRAEVAGDQIDEMVVQCMFDPQTSGGLLAAVPADIAEDVLSELRAGCAPPARAVGVMKEADMPVVTIGQLKEM